MDTQYNIGDRVAFKVAILFGLETLFREKLREVDPVKYGDLVIDWGRESFSQEEAGKVILSFIEPPKPEEIQTPPTNSQVRQYAWTVYIQGIMPDSLARPTSEAYELVSELKRILFEQHELNSVGNVVNNLLNLGPTAQKKRGDKNNVNGLTIGSETVRGPGEHSRFTFFWLPLAITIVEDMKNPRTVIQSPL